jgi:hypothetical protein
MTGAALVNVLMVVILLDRLDISTALLIGIGDILLTALIY